LSQLLASIDLNIPIFSPCYAHRCSLSIKHGEKYCRDFRMMVETLKNVSYTLQARECRVIIKHKCPKYCPIRWLEVQTVVRFLFKHLEKNLLT
jgi:hypothetical protein